jgi:hypothetical protein
MNAFTWELVTQVVALSAHDEVPAIFTARLLGLH